MEKNPDCSSAGENISSSLPLDSSFSSDSSVQHKAGMVSTSESLDDVVQAESRNEELLDHVAVEFLLSSCCRLAVNALLLRERPGVFRRSGFDLIVTLRRRRELIESIVLERLMFPESDTAVESRLGR